MTTLTTEELDRCGHKESWHPRPPRVLLFARVGEKNDGREHGIGGVVLPYLGARRSFAASE